MPLTKDPSVVIQALVDLLRTNWETIETPSETDIYYGDQNRYPRFPSLSVVNIGTDRPLYQTGLQMQVEFQAYVLVYHAIIGSESDLKKKCDERSEIVVGVIESDRKLGGLVVHGHVTRMEPGVASRGDLLTATRLTWEGQSRAQVG